MESIRRLEDFYRSIGMPTRLSEVKVGDDCGNGERRCSSGGQQPGTLTADDIEAIYRLAL